MKDNTRKANLTSTELIVQLFPKPKTAFEKQYKKECINNNVKFVWYFSLLACVIFGIHLAHHFRMGMEVFSPQMMPYTLMYTVAIIYSACNMLILSRLKGIVRLESISVVIVRIFPFFMAFVAVLLSFFTAKEGLGASPFSIIMLVICFTLQGHFILLSVLVALSFCMLFILLVWQAATINISPLIAISFTTSIACIVITHITEQMRIKQFEMLTELNSNNRRLQLLSLQDHLTGLLNRRAIDGILEKELSRSERFAHPLSLLLIDIDDFKQINDVYGHVFGDTVIQKVAKSINLHVREADFVARLGGDEFLVLLVETDYNSALQVANRMRLEVIKITSKDNNLQVTISAGHAVSNGEDRIALLEKADKALYQAKRAGKNQISSQVSA